MKKGRKSDKKFIVSACCVLTLSAFVNCYTIGTAHANAHTNDNASYELDTYTVKASRYKETSTDTLSDLSVNNKYVVTKEDIERKQARTVAQALNGIPGLMVTQLAGGHERFDMRGQGATAASNVIVLYNGIPLNSIDMAGVNTRQIAVEQIERIEVIPGGGMVMYGDGAIGGIINIITSLPKDKEYFGNIDTGRSSWDGKYVNGTVGGKVNENFVIQGSYSNWQNDGYRMHSAQDNSQNSFNGRYFLKNGYIDARYSHSDNSFENPGMSDPNTLAKYGPKYGYEYFWDNYRYETDNFQLAYNSQLSDKLGLLVYGGHSKGDMKYVSADPWGMGSSVYLTDREQDYIKTQLKYNYGNENYFVFGHDYGNGEVDSSSSKAERKNNAFYIMNKHNVGKFQLIEGYRHEKFDVSARSKYSSKDYNFNTNSVEFSALYPYSVKGNVYFNFSQGTRIPNVDELNLWSGDLEAQKTRNFEIGVREQFGITTANLSTFISNTENEIVYYPDPRKTYFSGKNMNFDGDIKRTGVTLALDHQFDKWSLHENISYVNPKITSGAYEGNRFPGVSKLISNVGFSYSFTNKLTLNGDWYYYDGRLAEDDFKNKYYTIKNKYKVFDSYSLFNVNLDYKVDDNLNIYMGMRNATNRQYATVITSSIAIYPENGREVYAGMKYKF
ncbi:Fe(3+) dicitrate transport protein FecA precursor [Sporomusa ovata DSM 2662]|uniref:TonB-dependent receptor Outer membrane receptor for ferrienterochelin and colicins n=1 Tax=Sporomusa ovata TaxID=2378 RepID=A0A0U1L5M0_9FIRM|nr:TonB-dependent receptor [Sporomusa ovata]EQB25878.1 outer membrane cobalamin receptor protein [Sporomusa ovata DSM 2662]CQR74453.1 hypothetical protein SpAn4DRAFT_0915 [Sporomusa ovata]